MPARTVSLIPHPACPPGPVARVQAEVRRQGGRLWLRFEAEGDIAAVRWPAPGRGRGDELWRHSCFEGFIGRPGGYLEVNLSPSGRWATYGFVGYRDGMSRASETAEVLGFVRGDAQAALEAVADLPSQPGPMGLGAVIEAQDGRLSYWALAHPSDKPDFHHPDSFVLDLP